MNDSPLDVVAVGLVGYLVVQAYVLRSRTTTGPLVRAGLSELGHVDPAGLRAVELAEEHPLVAAERELPVESGITTEVAVSAALACAHGLTFPSS